MNKIQYIFCDYTMITVYLYTVLKYYVFESDIYNLQFVVALLFSFSINLLSHGYNKMSENNRDTLMFVCHFLFMKTLFAIFCNIILYFYGIIFYYGFIETIIFLSSIYTFITCKSCQEIKESNNFKIAQIQKIYSIIYKTFSKIKHFFVEKNYHNKFMEFISYLFKNIYIHVSSINSLLYENKRSKILYTNLSNVMGEIKLRTINALVPIFMSKFMPPSFFTAPNFEDDLGFNFDNDYKNLLNNNMNMDFLKNSSISDFDNVEDLDEVEVTPTVNKSEDENIIKNQNTDKKLSDNIGNLNSSQPTREELRKRLRQKIKSKRGGQPDFDRVLESALTKNNIEKVMKQISSGGIKLN
ncbi:hypothetical protein H012_gp653 [Acanthamoeba polyphaga moumouvirus]|uniref:Uncharacterized protein n=1 Tax=Acanthamoeba polyphaga moumouvirus TaxID=1269028 RepID=L7RC28_9VIRU|nr:hypothetical protein H012_gp653 [Acanthamoeba polyphaga moumouvirus]AGC01812.1 hypothetical protein Moumou_00268 [Acanthamoeba polyphaga moumouvirus]AQN68164.1 hypothetical protein [Saudi moumouvirus]